MLLKDNKCFFAATVYKNRQLTLDFFMQSLLERILLRGVILRLCVIR